jgi:hypothetical protein
VAADLAKTAYYIGVRNPQDLQVFAVGGPTPDECEKLVSGFPGLITYDPLDRRSG